MNFDKRRNMCKEGEWIKSGKWPTRAKGGIKAVV